MIWATFILALRSQNGEVCTRGFFSSKGREVSEEEEEEASRSPREKQSLILQMKGGMD